MKRMIRASAGDVTLRKFVFVPMDKIDGVADSYWDEQLHGYFYCWDYIYNTLTQASEDRLFTHADVIDSMPSEVRRQARDLNVWGKTDYYRDGVRFVIVNEEYISKQAARRIKRMVLAD